MRQNCNKISENYIPSAEEEYMCDAHKEYFRSKLLKWREELQKESSQMMHNLKAENWNKPDVTDRASMELNLNLELRSKGRIKKLLEKIDIALSKIANDEYGYCEETGEEIGLKRLNARPIAVLSINAQERHETFERVHNDEV